MMAMAASLLFSLMVMGLKMLSLFD